MPTERVVPFANAIMELFLLVVGARSVPAGEPFFMPAILTQLDDIGSARVRPSYRTCVLPFVLFARRSILRSSARPRSVMWIPRVMHMVTPLSMHSQHNLDRSTNASTLRHS